MGIQVGRKQGKGSKQIPQRRETAVTTRKNESQDCQAEEIKNEKSPE